MAVVIQKSSTCSVLGLQLADHSIEIDRLVKTLAICFFMYLLPSAAATQTRSLAQHTKRTCHPTSSPCVCTPSTLRPLTHLLSRQSLPAPLPGQEHHSCCLPKRSTACCSPPLLCSARHRPLPPSRSRGKAWPTKCSKSKPICCLPPRHQSLTCVAWVPCLASMPGAQTRYFQVLCHTMVNTV